MEISPDFLLFIDRVPLVSAVLLDQWDLREPLVSLEALALLVLPDPR